MSRHVTEWLSAYHDSELHGARRQQVKAHLAECAACRAELEALQKLSALLQANPLTTGCTPPERFAAQVRLRLPTVLPSPRRKIAAIGWHAIPLGLIGGWAFSQAVLIVATVSALILESSPTLLTWVFPMGRVIRLGWLSAWPLPSWLACLAYLPNGQIGALGLGLSVVTLGLLAGWLASWQAYRQRDFIKIQ